MSRPIISSHASFDDDDRYYKFGRTSGLPVNYFGEGRRNRGARIMRRATLTIAILLVLFLGLWATSAAVPDELIRADAAPAKDRR